MATVLHQQQQSSAQGPITGDLLFVLRRADTLYQKRRTVPTLSPVDVHNHRASPPPEERRPSILDILMDSPRPGDSRRPSVMSSPRFMDDRRPSVPSSIHSAPERKTSLTPSSPTHLLTPPTSSFRRASVMSTSNMSTVSSIYSDSGTWEDGGSGLARSVSMQPGVTSNIETPRKKKENSFKEQLKRLVGWGSKSKKTPPPPLASTEQQNPQQIMQQNLSSISVQTPPTFADHSASQVSVASAPPMSAPPMSAPPTPLTPSPSSNKTMHPKITTQNPTEPATPIIDQKEAFNAPFSPIQQKAPSTADATSDRSPSVSSISSVDNDDDDVDDEEIQGIEVSDDSEDEQEATNTTVANIQKDGSMNDIQAQYAMWMDIQQGGIAATDNHQTPKSPTTLSNQDPPMPDHSSGKANMSVSPSSTSTVSSATQSSLASATCNTTSTTPTSTNTTTTSHPPPHETAHSEKVLVTESPAVTKPPEMASPEIMDDLYLLVTRGIDYLQSRESTNWDDDGGYDFHPWNRPDGSFSIRKKKQAAACQRPATEIVTDVQSLLNTDEQMQEPVDTQDASETSSASDSPKPQEGETKRANSLSKNNPRPVVNHHPAVQPSTQNEALIDEVNRRSLYAFTYLLH